jgi:hypothetical protein
VVAPVLVTVVPATTEDAAAVPRSGAVAADQAGDEVNATVIAPPTNTVAPSCKNFRDFCIRRCCIIHLLD